MSWKNERGRVASLTRSRAADDPELVAARRNLKAERLAEHVACVVSEAPSLTEDQLARIAALLRSGGSMPPNDKRRPPAKEAPLAQNNNRQVSPTAPADPSSACEAYVVLVITPAGKYRRRVMLSLHSATKAVERATDAGQPAHLILCRLERVTADLGPRWSM